MAESKVPSIIERNTALFEELEQMPVGDQKIFYSEESPVNEYLRAIQEKYGSRISDNEQLNKQFPFRLTLCTGALIVVKLKEVE